MMQFMDDANLGEKSTIGILDLTRVNQASQTVNLRKDSEMYNNISNKQFNKEVVDLSSKAKARVSLYIAKAMHVFVKDDKKTIKISYFLSKFHLYFQLCIEI
jgi:hypothetical protein